MNARIEPVATKPAFRAAFKKQRCLVPTTGYYERSINAEEARKTGGSSMR
ncbi:SOS response-associated peptidase family protein [Stenotrophomonas sp. PS02289]|nr:SOS response-associated peptidase family protein [Stenotrophomonas sp. PS02289]